MKSTEDTMIQIPWTHDDDADLQALLQGIKEGDLTQALLAIEGAPPLVRLECSAELERWSEEVSEGLQGEGPEAAALALRAVLVGDHDLRGDTKDYNNPLNSGLSQVMSRRRGLPILLSAIWSVVGKGAGVVVEGVGLPFHFIVRVGGEGGLLVDPFERGRFLSEGDCKALIEQRSRGQLSWREDFLTPTTPTALLERVLRNLMSSFPRSGDVSRLYRIVRLMAAIREDSPHHQLALARLSQSLGHTNSAMSIYGEILRRFPESKESDIAGQHLSGLSSMVHLVN